MNNLELVETPTKLDITPVTTEDIVNKFINSQDVLPSSRDVYRRTLRLFFQWLDQKGYKLSDLSRVEILEYKDGLLKSGLSSLTVGSYLTVVKLFFTWAEANKYYPNVARGIRSPKRRGQFEKRPLTHDQSKALLSHFETRALRNFALINLILRVGLRTIEVVRADIGDITFRGGKRILLVHGKGEHEKNSYVVLTPKTYTPIKKYLETRAKAKQESPLFSSQSNNKTGGGRLTTRTIRGIIKEGLKSVGLDDKAYSAHSLRHTAGTNILRAGGQLLDVQTMLRHKDSNTSQLYVKFGIEEQRLKAPPEELLDNLF